MRKRTVVEPDSLPASIAQDLPAKELVDLPVWSYASVIQLGIGVDLLGSKVSLNSKMGNLLECTMPGVIATSRKTKRRVFIPWANIRAAELI
jgi:hypothetical protein